jgi:hypothetical protein
LFGRTGEGELEFSGAAGDQDFDGVQAAGLHLQAELFVDFVVAVLLEAFAHVGASARGGLIAMLNAVYFIGSGARIDRKKSIGGDFQNGLNSRHTI